MSEINATKEKGEHAIHGLVPRCNLMLNACQKIRESMMDGN